MNDTQLSSPGATAAPLEDRRVLLGVCGGIAAYKSAELTRALVREGARVQVVMTEAATRLVQPLTFEVLSTRPVACDMWQTAPGTRIQHTDHGRQSDLIIIAPATANTIGRIAGGLADNLLTSLVMASRTPVLLAPAMNVEMWSNPLVQENLARLTNLARYHVVPPESGELACGVDGAGRLAPIDQIMDDARRLLSPQDLAGRFVLVTAGPTYEPFDPVRFVGNHSTGLMGYALAAAAQLRGARVVLISGPTALNPPRGVEVVSVTTAIEMRAEVMTRLAEADMLAMVAAVSDYRPTARATAKIHKTSGDKEIRLALNPDILAEVGSLETRPLTLGFAAETEDVVAAAHRKRAAKNVDFLFGNLVGGGRGGFACRKNSGVLVDRSGTQESFPLVDKAELAHALLDRLAPRLATRTPEEVT